MNGPVWLNFYSGKLKLGVCGDSGTHHILLLSILQFL